MTISEENKTRLRRLIHGLSNPFTLLIVVAVIWILFIGNHSVMKSRELSSKINDLNKEKDYYIKKIADDSIQIHELIGNKDNLEKFARERYLMKRADEDIFYIEK